MQLANVLVGCIEKQDSEAQDVPTQHSISRESHSQCPPTDLNLKVRWEMNRCVATSHKPDSSNMLSIT